MGGAKAVMRSNPAAGSRVAKVIEDKVIQRPDIAGVKSPVSTQGEAGKAPMRGEGNMAIFKILPYPQIEPVSPLPRAWGLDRHVHGGFGTRPCIATMRWGSSRLMPTCPKPERHKLSV
jgi:hypothetical protein